MPVLVGLIDREFGVYIDTIQQEGGPTYWTRFILQVEHTNYIVWFNDRVALDGDRGAVKGAVTAPHQLQALTRQPSSLRNRFEVEDHEWQTMLAMARVAQQVTKRLYPFCDGSERPFPELDSITATSIRDCARGIVYTLYTVS